MTKIKLENICYTYGVGTPFEIAALKDINLEIEEGSITGVIGHTGSGKSTLMQLLNGLEKPTSGKVLLDGKDIWEEPKKISAIRFRVGLVMQYPEYQLFEETVERDIAFGPSNMKLAPVEITKRVSDAVEIVGLNPALLEKSPFDLSGGEKRRVAIAGVMAMTPEVLVLDEPAAGLDPIGRSVIFKAITGYRNRTGATIIIVSHSMEDMARICDNVIVLSSGRVIVSDKTDVVFSKADLLAQNGLDIPEISKVMLALRGQGIEFDKIPYTVDDAVALIESRLRV